MNKLALLAAAAALPLAACSAENETDDAAMVDPSPSASPTTTAANDPSLTTTAGLDYVGMAGAADMFEIETSRLALENATSDEVKQFAQMMIDNHTASTREITAAAEAAGLTPPTPALSPTQEAMLQNLRTMTGERFDSAYLGQQADAHQMALNLHRTYAEGGDTPQLREVAAKTVGVVEQHIQELQGLQGAAGAGTATGTGAM